MNLVMKLEITRHLMARLQLDTVQKLPEILEYRTFLKDSYLTDNFHLYPDRREIIKRLFKFHLEIRLIINRIIDS